MSASTRLAGLTLDAGALIGLERRAERVTSLLREAHRLELSVVIPAGALAQVWRDGRKQARLAHFVKVGIIGDARAPTIEPLHELMARQAGALCGLTGTSDVIDASVVLVARMHGHAVVTSDPADLAKLDSELQLIVV